MGEAATPTRADPATFEEQRALLFGIAYRMMGTVADAEDIVQDAWLRYADAAPIEVHTPRAYLATIVTRLALDRLKSAHHQREQYVGPWLPEPIVTTFGPRSDGPEEEVLLRESLSFAFLMLLESLSPMERAVFLLADVFSFSHAEIAQLTGRAAATCRQHLHRARTRIAEHRPRFTCTYEDRRRLTAAFVRASTGSLDSLLTLLAADVVAISDGGGKASAARTPVVGAQKVGLYSTRAYRNDPPYDGFSMLEINGQPGFATYHNGHALNVMVFEFDEQGLLTVIYTVRNPDKLKRVRAPGASTGSLA